MTTSDKLRAAKTDYESIVAEELTLTLPHFTADDAFALGCALRTRLRSISPKPALINITLANSLSPLFHCASRPGVQPDNDTWVARKRNSVLRWGVSSWALNCKFKGDEAGFGKTFSLGDRAGEFAIHGGGVPVRVKGVEGTVAVVVVSGLKQDMDHQVVVEALEAFVKECEEEK
ncbi:DUF336-domain-containing protein [Pleomassaria siparia CBS 279.74]|uniref:DUF336-domain-containing protein n=1 Tax=Pleomassaria siparia CBS 279.74 TaxID=1314801 RepID=A0A6G1K8D5_9PLEO|nr:DUF336-domain-containing protein [Pleomassaria siparia CBS 279.74]